MINRFIALLLFFSVGATAQINTSSPYSFFGIGTTQFKGTIESRSMGGLSVYSDSIRVNLQNPAGLSRFKLVNFSVAGSYNYVDLQSENRSSIASTTAINYIALGIPLTEKLGVSFGLLPYTSVGYGLTSVSGQTIIYNSGEGGTNKVFLGAGYQVMPELSVGLEAAYNFGKIENTTIFNQDDIQYGTKELNQSALSGFSFNLGVAYKKMISEKLELQSGATFGLESKLNSENFRQLSSVLVLNENIYAEIDIMEVDVDDTKLTMPTQYSFGLGIGEPRKWFAGAEYFSQQKNNYINRTFTLANVEAKNASTVKLGGFYIPDYRSISSYWNRVTYRAGVRYENTGLILNQEDINEFGISFGVGLPLGRLFSNINLGVEVGQRGTTNAGLVKENFFNTFISLSLNDRWFVKTLYD